MSSFAGYCRDCCKPVMHKTLLGTLHICAPPEYRQDYQRQQQLAVMQQQASIGPDLGQRIRDILERADKPAKQKLLNATNKAEK